MKKITLFIIAIITLVSFKSERSKDYLILSGTVKNLPNDTFELKNLTGSFKRKIKVDQDGKFSDTLNVESGYYFLNFNKMKLPVYLNKSEDLQIVFDLKDTAKNMVFIGQNADENNYLFAKSQMIASSYGQNKNLYSLPEKDFLTKIETIENTLKVLANSSKLNPGFLSQELRNIHYITITCLDNYESFHRDYTDNKSFSVSDSFPSEYDPTNLNNIADFENSLDYRNIIQTHFYKEVMSQPNINDDIYNIVNMNLVNREVTNPIIKNQLLFDNAKYAITYVNDIDPFYNEFMASSTNEKDKAEITEKYNILQKTAKGKPSPKFINYENFKGGTTSLDDLKGKYVYIDVWATWCGPCKKEIPFLKKIEKLYHKKNIAFVSISVNKSEDLEKWKEMIKDQEMAGIQLFADKDWESDFIKDYQIIGIPRFILIDPEGKIVAASAQRPSNPELIVLFNKLKI